MMIKQTIRLFYRHFQVVTVVLLLLLSINSPQAKELTELLIGETASENSASPDKVISVDHSKQTDKKIEKRLAQIFSEIDELKGIAISASNGIVTLSGEVGSKAGEEKAVRFAKQIEDVIEVDNRLAVTHSLNKRLRTTLNKIRTLAEQFLAGLPLLGLALLIFSFFWMIGSWLSKRKGVFRRISINDFIAELLGKLVHLVFIIIGVVVALSILDATALLGTILGAAGIFGLAVGFAIRDTVENFIASILLSIRNPFEVTDFVDIEGWQGSVARLTSRATILISPDGNHIRIPNSTVFKSVITNYSRNPERRFQFSVGIGVDENLASVQGTALKMLETVPGVLAEPKPQVIVEDFGESNIVLTAFAWINQKNHDFLKVRSEAIKTIKQSFEQARISMPSPQYLVKVSNIKPTASGKTDDFDGGGISAVTDDQIKDISVDRTVEKQIEKENIQEQGQNLLAPDASTEI